MTISVDTLRYYRDLTKKSFERFYRLTTEATDEDIVKMVDEANKLLDEVESQMMKIEIFLTEEGLSNNVIFRGTDVIPPVEVTDMPPEVDHTFSEADGTHKFTLPLWPFLPRRARQVRQPFHQYRPYMRPRDYWAALLKNLVSAEETVYDRYVVREDRKDAHVHCTFYTVNRIDYDNFDIGQFINALVASGVLLRDHPQNLSVTVSYQQQLVQDGKQERAEVRIEYLSSQVGNKPLNGSCGAFVW